MAKVLHSLVIALLVAVVYSFPLEQKPEHGQNAPAPLHDHKPEHAPNAPHVLKSQPQPHLHDNKPQIDHHKINRPKRDEPQTRSDQQDQTAYQGPTPKPVHHYRDEPIIQRRSAESSSDKSKSSEENSRSDEHKYQNPVFQRDNADKSSSEENSSSEEDSRSEEKRNPEIKTHQRRDTRDQNNKEENQSTFQKSNPSVLASNPNFQAPALKSTSDDQNAPHILASNPSPQYGLSSSTRIPDLIPASSTNLRTSDLTGNQEQGKVKNDQNRQPLGASDETSAAKVAGDDPQQRKTRDADEKISPPLLSSSQNDEPTKLKSSTTNQEQRDSFENQPHGLSSHPNQQSSSQNRRVRDVNENQPHLLASNPQTSLNNRDESSSRSAAPVLSSSTTENTRILNSHVHKL